MKKMLNKINSLMFSPIVASMSNVSTMIEDVTLLEDLRHELKIVSSDEYEIKFFEETKHKSSEQPYRNFNFIISAYREEILNKKMGN